MESSVATRRMGGAACPAYTYRARRAEERGSLRHQNGCRAVGQGQHALRAAAAQGGRHTGGASGRCCRYILVLIEKVSTQVIFVIGVHELGRAVVS